MLKIEGDYENKRNATHGELYKAIIRECFGVTDVIIAHHLVYVTGETRIEDGKPFHYEVVEEVPSADCLIFDHEIAKKVWGEDKYIDVLVALATEPVETRDKLLGELYYGRGK